MKTFVINISSYFQKPPTLLEALFLKTSLNKDILIDAGEKGAVWIKNKKSGMLRCRNLNQKSNLDDQVFFFYDPKVLALPELLQAECLFENNHYGIWFKKSGVLSQGSQSSDHTSLYRYIEKNKKSVFLIHRLDRETAGVMVYCYSKEAARLFSEMFQNHKITKIYRAVVKGVIGPSTEKTIRYDLDQKKAVTHFNVLNSANDQTLVEITLETGRLHQIRRHFEMIGHPLIGDPKYGKGNKNREGLKLIAHELRFKDPWTKKEVIFNSPEILEF
jgi:tRNA pseudouridine32 synthase/23S rRNA pseudouridine746 synthase